MGMTDFSSGARDDYGSRDYGGSGYGGGDYGSGQGYGSSGYGSRDYGSSGYGGRDHGGQGRHRDRAEERGFFERAGDEVASWFGDEDAQRRREADASHRGRGPRNYSRSDERIRDDVSDRLSDDRHIDASDIEVTVNGGEVTLDGTVDSRMAKRHAEDLAESCSGVKHVQNNLRVKDRQAGSGGSGSMMGGSASGGSGGMGGSMGSGSSGKTGMSQT